MSSTEKEQFLPDDSTDHGTIMGHMARYVFASRFVPDKTCLDIACGMGYGSNYLAKMGARMVVGGDASVAAVRAAKTSHRTGELHFAQINAQRLPFNDDSFDVVVSMETIEHLPRPEQFLQECRRVLKPKGMLVCSTPNRRIYTQKNPRRESPFNPFHMSPYHIREFDVTEFQALMGGARLQCEALYGQDLINRDLSWKANNFTFWLARRIVRTLPGGRGIQSFGRRRLLKEPDKSVSEWFKHLDNLDEPRLIALANDIRPLLPEADSMQPTNLIVLARKQG